MNEIENLNAGGLDSLIVNDVSKDKIDDVYVSGSVDVTLKKNFITTCEMLNKVI